MSPPAHHFKIQPSSEEAYNIQVVETNNSYEIVFPTTLEHAHSEPAKVPTSIGTEMEHISSGSTQNVKRIRTTFTSEQITFLEREFENAMFLKRPRRMAIAQRLSLSEKNVKIWFQNRRSKHKQAEKELKESSTVPKAQTRIWQNEHDKLVQRLMSYSQDPVIRMTQEPVQQQSYSSNVSYPVAITTKNPSSTPDLEEILELLGESFPEDNQIPTSDCSSSPLNFDMEEQPARKKFKLSDESYTSFTNSNENGTSNAAENEVHVNQQWAPTVPSPAFLPYLNLTWEEPNFIHYNC